MPPDTEQELLRDYVDNCSDAAFEGLVSCHIGMVFGCALRRTGDATLSEEISQAVFTILARKAHRLAIGAGLAGWLHRTTLYESAKAVRGEARRRRKMKALANHALIQDENGALDSEIIPIVDEAIDELPEDDRRMVLMHYFEGCSFKEISRRVGKSAAARQKQTSRALGKLENILRRRGVVATASTLGAIIASESAKAAPAGIVATISGGALAGAPSVTASALAANAIQTMTYAKTKVALLIAAVAAVPIGIQMRSIGNLRDQLKQYQVREEGFAARGTRVANLEARNALSAKRADVETRYSLAKASGKPKIQRAVEFAAFLDSANASDLGKIYAMLTEDERWGRDVLQEFGMFIDWAAHTDPHSALALFREDGLENRFGEQFFTTWAISSPEAMLAELETSVIDLRRWGLSIYGALSGIGDPSKQRVAELLGPGHARQIAMEDARALVRREGMDAAIGLAAPKLEGLHRSPRVSAPGASSGVSIDGSDLAPFTMATHLTNRAIKDLIDQTLRSNPDLAAADRMTGVWAGPLIEELAKRDPRETMEWLLKSGSSEQLTPLINDAIKVWAGDDIDACLEFIRTTPMSHQRQINLLTGIVNSGGGGDPALVEDAWKRIWELKAAREKEEEK